MKCSAAATPNTLSYNIFMFQVRATFKLVRKYLHGNTHAQLRVEGSTETVHEVTEEMEVAWPIDQ